MPAVGELLVFRAVAAPAAQRRDVPGRAAAGVAPNARDPDRGPLLGPLLKRQGPGRAAAAVVAPLARDPDRGRRRRSTRMPGTRTEGRRGPFLGAHVRRLRDSPGTRTAKRGRINDVRSPCGIPVACAADAPIDRFFPTPLSP